MVKKILIALCLGGSATAATVALDVKEAMNKQVLSADFVINGYGAIGQCLKGIYTNLTDDTLEIVTPDGTYLDCYDPLRQDLMITQRSSIRLHKKESKSIGLFAMCCRRSLFSPTTESAFVLAPNPEPLSIRLCELIDSLSLNCYTGQTALWCLMDRTPISNIAGARVSNVNALRRYVALNTNQQFLDYSSDWRLKHDPIYRPAKPKQVVSLGERGSYFINGLNSDDKIEFILYNDFGLPIRKLGYEPLPYGSQGLMMRNLSVGDLEADQVYYARVLKNGTLLREWYIDVKES